MEAKLPDVLNLVFMTRADDSVLERVRAVAPDRLNVVRVWDELLAEIDDWGRSTPRRDEAAAPLRSPAEVDALLQEAHIAYLGVAFPKSVPKRMPNLLWAHFAFAGVSNLMGSDWWQAPFLTTSARGVNSALPIAETTMAAVFLFAKRLDVAVQKTAAHDHRGRGPGVKLIAGKTLAIVGLGGIGSNLARLARGCGMRVLATRGSATERRENVDGVDVLFPPSQQNEMLAAADFVAVCAMWTPATERLLDGAAFAAMKPGAFLMNIARGELVDEAALVEALVNGRLAGAYLDVWDDDLYGKDPSPALQAAPNVIFTSHASGRSDVPQGFSLDLFCRNIERLLRGQPLENVVDWSRGY